VTSASKSHARGTVVVPFVDLEPMNRPVKGQVLARMGELIDVGDFTNGAAVENFEHAFAQYGGRRECVGVASGLDALRLALLTTELDPGAGVIVPAATFAASYEAVLQAGGRPVVVDIGDDYGIDVSQVDRVGDEATHVMPVHLYGQLTDLQSLAEIAGNRGLTVIEDACQAHGASRSGVRPGDLSRAAAFSFYPSKNLGAMGDAGALVTDDAELAASVRALRVHGETRKYHHEHVGYTARLDTMQAIVLLEKLPLLDKWNRLRSAAARFYSEALADVDGLRLPRTATGSQPVWHLYVIRTGDPNSLAQFLAERGIQTGRHYPEPVHLAPAYRDLGYAPGDFPVAETLAQEGLSLPLYPGITEAQLGAVCEAISAYFAAD
jgi:dTDP-4-amino-4,6-dideoxygalactose transaminase